MLAILATALLVERFTRRYAGSGRPRCFAAMAFMFCPMLLRKIRIAEPDTIITLAVVRRPRRVVDRRGARARVPRAVARVRSPPGDPRHGQGAPAGRLLRARRRRLPRRAAPLDGSARSRALSRAPGGGDARVGGGRLPGRPRPLGLVHVPAGARPAFQRAALRARAAPLRGRPADRPPAEHAPDPGGAPRLVARAARRRRRPARSCPSRPTRACARWRSSCGRGRRRATRCRSRPRWPSWPGWPSAR